MEGEKTPCKRCHVAYPVADYALKTDGSRHLRCESCRGKQKIARYEGTERECVEGRVYPPGARPPRLHGTDIGERIEEFRAWLRSIGFAMTRDREIA